MEDKTTKSLAPSLKAKKLKKKRRPRHVYWASKMLPIVRNLAGLGLNEAEIGLVFGFTGKDPRQWLNNIKKHHPEVLDGWKYGKKAAMIEAVGSLWLESTGYDYDEVCTEQELIKDENGNPILDKDGNKQFETVKVKTTKKHARPDPSLLKYLLTTQLPEFFRDSKVIDIRTQHLSFEAKAELNRKEIEEFAGRLLELSKDDETIKDMVKEDDIIDVEFRVRENDDQS